MEVTRQFWGTAALAVALAAGAVVLARPFLLAGAAVVGAWLLTRGYAFARAIARTDSALGVEQTLDTERATVDERVRVTMSADLDEPSSLGLSIEAGLPVALTGAGVDRRSIRLAPGMETADIEFPVTCTTAGAFRFGPATVRVTGPRGLFADTLERGSRPTLAVDPRGPRNVHVGEGGDEIAAAFGEHPAGRSGAGLTPAEVREYVPGDAARRIDWKATARLNTPHVREFEAETDRETVLLVDHRSRMALGPAGETKLDYLRQVALAFLASARDLTDPVGCFTVGDEGVTGDVFPSTDPDHYLAVRRRLLDLAPTDPGTATPTPERSPGLRGGTDPASARRRADHLAGDETPFGTTLRPYFRASRTYVERVERKPLFATARTYLSRIRGSLWTVVLTDDTDRTEVRETVKFARQGGNHVIVLMTPTVLFEPGSLGDIEDAYRRYLDFEEYRRELARLDRVWAYEVGPGERVERVLAARRRATTR